MSGRDGRVNSPRVVIVQRRMTHYRVPLFETMRKLLNQSGIRLDVVYGDAMPAEASKRDSGSLAWGMHVPCRYFLGGRLCWQDARSVIRDADLVVVTQENKLLLNVYLLLGRRTPVALWGHGRNFQSRNPRGVGERMKRWLSRHCDWWFAYTELSAEVVRGIGFPPERITVLNNAVDTSELMRFADSVGTQEVQGLKVRHGIGEGPIGIAIASLHADKRLPFLFEAARLIRDCNEGFELIVLGDGPDRETVRRAAEASGGWIHWMGARSGREKMQFLAMSRVLLNPGMVGLNVLDAFVAGVPMITTDCGIHSPEIAYLENGVNGMMTRDEVHEYARVAAQVLSDSALYRRLRSQCLRDAQTYRLDAMAERFVEGIKSFLACTGRASASSLGASAGHAVRSR